MAEAERISIVGGRLVDPANDIDAELDVHIADERILAVGPAPGYFTATRVIDATGQVVCPGLVDLWARLREPGDEHKATIKSETHAAAAAGVTTLCCPPDTKPVVDTPAVARLIVTTARRYGKTRVIPAGALTQGLKGRHISEMAALKRAGCRVVSNADAPIENTLVLRRAMEYAAGFELVIFLRPEDHHLCAEGCVHEGRVGTRLGLPGIPEAAETVALAQELALAEQTGARVHFRGLSCARATEMLAEARRRNIAATADVSAHQLFLTEDDVADFDGNCHVRPPLRTVADRSALRSALVRGDIGAICSDHQPHEEDAKLAPFPLTEPGVTALETYLPLVLRLVADGILDLKTALSRVTSDPARILGLDIGQLEVGRKADICIFDPAQEWVVSPATLISLGHNTAFNGQRVAGRVNWTLLEGRVVFEREAGR